MALYRVLKPSFINNVYHEEGVEIEFDGIPADNLELVHPHKKSHKPAHEVSDLA